MNDAQKRTFKKSELFCDFMPIGLIESGTLNDLKQCKLPGKLVIFNVYRVKRFA